MKKLMALSLPICLSFLACSGANNSNSNNPNKNKPTDLGQDKALAYKISIVNNKNEALKSAKVLIGDSLNPNASNFLTSNENGEISLQNWTQNSSISIEAAGYIRASFLQLAPGNYKFTLNPQMNAQLQEVKGLVSGFGNLTKDDKVDFGLVMPQLAKKDLIRFDLNNIISPSFDTLNVSGYTFNLPSNISLPKQSERYSIINVTLDKPTYRIQLPNQGEYNFVAAHGSFPFKKVIGQLRDGKSIFDVINDLSFSQAGVKKVNVIGPNTSLDMSVNQIPFNTKVTAKAPSLTGDKKFIAVSMYKNINEFFPTDVKKLTTNETKDLIATGTTNEQFTLGVVCTEKVHNNNQVRLGQAMSVSFLPSAKSLNTTYLEFPKAPQFNGEQLQFVRPSNPNNMQELVTYANLQDVEVISTEQVYYENKKVKWEFYAPGWVESINLPKWPGVHIQQNVQRLEVIYYAKENSGNANIQNLVELNNKVIGAELLESATHATKNASDL